MKFFATFLMVALTLQNVFSATYYVRDDGNDGNAGTSNTSGGAFRTVQHASDVSAPGDIIRVQAGTFNERVVHTTDGVSTNWINFIADGVVHIYGFYIQADYARVKDFVIYHPTNSITYPGIYVTMSHDVELWKNIITNTADASIEASATLDTFYIGNVAKYPGSPVDNSGGGTKIMGDSGSPRTNEIVRYNNFSHSTDFMCSYGEKFLLGNNILGPSITNDFSGPHVDGWQANAQTRYGFMEANWHVDNPVADSHMILIEAPVSGRNAHFVVVKNVSLRSGDQLWFQMRDGTNLHAAFNTVGQIGYGPRGGPASSGFFYAWSDANGPSINNFSLGNIFTNCITTNGVVYTINSGSDVTHSYDLTVPNASDITAGSEGNLETDPKFVDYALNDLRLMSNSPCIDAGPPRLTSVSSASATTNVFTVTNADWFFDGFNKVAGHRIFVGTNNNCLITNVNYATKTISLLSAVTFTNGAAVGYAHLGSAPDMGAIEYGAVMLTSATITNVSTTWTVTPDGDTRFVQFYSNGIPHTAVYGSPYTATFTAGTITADAFPLHAQATNIFAATYAGGGEGGGSSTVPTFPKVLRQ